MPSGNKATLEPRHYIIGAAEMNESTRQARVRSHNAMEAAVRHARGFTAHIVTSGSISVIDEWLNMNAKGRWAIRVEGGDSAEGATRYAVRFSDEADRAIFRARFTRRPPA